MKNLLKLFVGLLLLFGFVFITPIFYLKIPTANSVFQIIEEKQINADALFYSEEEATGTAVFEISNSLMNE